MNDHIKQWVENCRNGEKSWDEMSQFFQDHLLCLSPSDYDAVYEAAAESAYFGDFYRDWC